MLLENENINQKRFVQHHVSEHNNAEFNVQTFKLTLMGKTQLRTIRAFVGGSATVLFFNYVSLNKWNLN